jgi:hypothetical protein
VAPPGCADARARTRRQSGAAQACWRGRPMSLQLRRSARGAAACWLSGLGGLRPHGLGSRGRYRGHRFRSSVATDVVVPSTPASLMRRWYRRQAFRTKAITILVSVSTTAALLGVLWRGVVVVASASIDGSGGENPTQNLLEDILQR